ncbi:hypothetical protein D3C72_783940 [compost metagenome]
MRVLDLQLFLFELCLHFVEAFRQPADFVLRAPVDVMARTETPRCLYRGRQPHQRADDHEAVAGDGGKNDGEDGEDENRDEGQFVAAERGQKADIVIIDRELPDRDGAFRGLVGHLTRRRGGILNDVAAGGLDDIELAGCVLDLDHADHGVGNEGAGNLVYGVVIKVPQGAGKRLCIGRQQNFKVVTLAANGFVVGKRQQKREERGDHCKKCAGNNRDKATFDGMSHVRLQLPFAPDLLRPLRPSGEVLRRFSARACFPIPFPQPGRCSTTAQGYRFMEVLIDAETGSVSCVGGKLSGFKVHKN